jgi:hypothetical protein
MFCLDVKDTWAAPRKILDCSSNGVTGAFGPLESGPSTFQPMGEKRGF